jgi:O-methyltransferase
MTMERSTTGSDHAPSAAPDTPVALYLDLLKRTLTNWVYAYAETQLTNDDKLGRQVAIPRPADPRERAIGCDFPPTAHTMIGFTRLGEIQSCIDLILSDGVPGDLLEAGVWRGGAAIFMRGVLRAYGITDRTVFLADSFAGFPEPDFKRYPREQFREEFRHSGLAVSRDEVARNFELYGLLDDQVKFIEGYFDQSLRDAPVDQLALLRLDVDLYASTMQALEALYAKLSIGGFVLIDDYGYHEACRHAVEDFRAAHGITDTLVETDWTGVRWRKTR